MTFKDILQTIDRVLDKTVAFFSVLFFLCFFIAILLQVFSRYVLGNPIVWSEEAARYLNIWFVFIAASLLTKQRRHLAVNLIAPYLTKLSKKIRLLHNVLIEFCLLILLAIMFKGSIIMVRNTWDIKLVTVPISRGFIFLPLTISAVLMFYYLARNILLDIFKIFNAKEVS